MQRLLQLYHKYPSKGNTAQILSSISLRSVNITPLLVETKHRIEKKDQNFELENWLHTPDLVVGRWVSKGGNESPVGAYSWGVWWKNKNIGVYRIHDPHGNLMAYRLDVLKNVIITTQDKKIYRVEFSDLVVDMWLWPPDIDNSVVEVTIEDLFERFCLRKEGKISNEECLMIDNEIESVVKDPKSVINSIDDAINTAISRIDDIS